MTRRILLDSDYEPTGRWFNEEAAKKSWTRQIKLETALGTSTGIHVSHHIVEGLPENN
jgi:hypothetical protein